MNSAQEIEGSNATLPYQEVKDRFSDETRRPLLPLTCEQLKTVARERGIKLYTTVPGKMIDAIVSAETRRKFHGHAFWYSGSKS
jgi:hypothetical protein